MAQNVCFLERELNPELGYFLRVGYGSLNNPLGPSVLTINEENETGLTDSLKTRTAPSFPYLWKD